MNYSFPDPDPDLDQYPDPDQDLDQYPDPDQDPDPDPDQDPASKQAIFIYHHLSSHSSRWVRLAFFICSKLP